MDPDSEAWVARRMAHENEQAARQAFGLTRLPYQIQKRTGFVYVIWADGTDLVKLGYASDVKRRLRELQTGSPHKLEILEVFPADHEEERAVHWRWRESNVRDEWFTLTEEMMVILEKLKALRDPSDA